MKGIRSIVKGILDRQIVPYIASRVNNSLQSERALIKNPSDQLFYDVANFSVFNQIRGDYLEFGVYKGKSFSRVYGYLLHQWNAYLRHAAEYGHEIDSSFWDDKKFIAFDSFQGLPNCTDSRTPAHYSKGVYKATEEQFRPE